MLFMVVKEIVTRQVQTVLTVTLKTEKNLINSLKEEENHLNFFDHKKENESTLWLRFINFQFGSKKHWGAEYRDILEKIRNNNSNNEFALLVLNKTDNAIDIVNTMICNDAPGHHDRIENFCIIPRDSLCVCDLKYPEGSYFWLKAISTCDQIAENFFSSLYSNKDLNDKAVIKHLLGTNHINLRPNTSSSVDAGDWKEYIQSKHHEVLKKYLDTQGFEASSIIED